MEFSRFVRINREGATSGGGTGYLLSGDRVLTARHVVKQGYQGLVVHFDGPTEAAKSLVEGIEWEGDVELDVAVLAVETGLLLPRLILDPRAFHGELPWRSRGWARASQMQQDKKSKMVDSMSALSGRAYEFSSTAKRMELGVDDPPVHSEWWKGCSGAPAFHEDWLIGVIVQGDGRFDGKRLSAVPVAALLQIEKFRLAICYDEGWREQRVRRRRELVDHLTELLSRESGAAEALALENEPWKRALRGKETGGVPALAEALVATPSWRSVLLSIDSAHEKLQKAGDSESLKSASVLCDILNRLLPEVFAATETLPSPFQDGATVLNLPVESETLAEISVAAIHGRPMMFKPQTSERDSPEGFGLYRFETLSQPTDFDYKKASSVREWIIHFATWLRIPTRSILKLGTADRFGELARLVNFELETDVRRNKLPRRYFAFGSDFKESHAEFLKQIAELLPALELVVVSGHGYADETMSIEPLRSILFRSRESKNKKGRGGS